MCTFVNKPIKRNLQVYFISFLYYYLLSYVHNVKVILTCCDSAYPFTAVVPYPVVCIYIYLPCVAVMLDRWYGPTVSSPA